MAATPTFFLPQLLALLRQHDLHSRLFALHMPANLLDRNAILPAGCAAPRSLLRSSAAHAHPRPSASSSPLAAAGGAGAVLIAERPVTVTGGRGMERATQLTPALSHAERVSAGRCAPGPPCH